VPADHRNTSETSTESISRSVLLVGSIPLRPAARVFEVVAEHLGGLVRRIPDGEQRGWLFPVWEHLAKNDALVLATQVPLNPHMDVRINIYRLKSGRTAGDLVLGPYGIAENAVASYAQFRTLRTAGKIAPDVRFQVTVPGPGTTAYPIQVPAHDLLPRAREALWRELERVLAGIASADLTIQLDVAMEAEHEEYLRRRVPMELPIQEAFHWTQAEMADSVAWLANRIPSNVELGFHICSIWHHYPDFGQDNAVLVDTANAVIRRITRPVGYVHIPMIPEHDRPEDFAPLADLKLPSETELYLGLLNLADGLEGARRRITLAEAVRTQFGIAFYCGLGIPPAELVPPSARADRATSDEYHPGLRRATPETIAAVLDLHRAASHLSELRS
jgi:hypothetical protein